MFKVFVTRKIPDQGIKLLKQYGYRVKVSPYNRVIEKKEIIAMGKGSDALLCILTDTIDGKVMDGMGRKLKIIANYAVGFDNIDLKAARERNIMVTNTPINELSESVAEHVIALMFSLAHRIVEVDAFTRAGKYKGWGPELLLGTDIRGKKIGIIGLGRIGKALTRRLAQGFEVKIFYSDIKRDKKFEKQFGAQYVSKQYLLKNSDFVTLHVPLLTSTRHLIGAKELRLMKHTAYLINTSRGPVVDELALVKALSRKQIAGVGLDVFECEPLIDCNPNDIYELRKLDNVILTPHTASATIETRQAMSMTAAKNIIAGLSGKTPPNLIISEFQEKLK
ncbi:D-glycerate dehydrogenase [Patescibacteria group bacterium AH-259-L07]|nr:D-glycerate dehydrogenase [Patescibacteria group bacterium AH-259-L07]